MSDAHTGAIRLAHGIEVVSQSGFTVVSASLQNVEKPDIRVRCDQCCWDSVAAGLADYYTVGGRRDLIHYRIGRLRVADCRVYWEEWGDDIIAADDYLKRRKKHVDAMGISESGNRGAAIERVQ